MSNLVLRADIAGLQLFARKSRSSTKVCDLLHCSQTTQHPCGPHYDLQKVCSITLNGPLKLEMIRGSRESFYWFPSQNTPSFFCLVSHKTIKVSCVWSLSLIEPRCPLTPAHFIVAAFWEMVLLPHVPVGLVRATVVSVRHIPHLLERGIVGRRSSLSEKLLRPLCDSHFVTGDRWAPVEDPQFLCFGKLAEEKLRSQSELNMRNFQVFYTPETQSQ